MPPNDKNILNYASKRITTGAPSAVLLQLTIIFVSLSSLCAIIATISLSGKLNLQEVMVAMFVLGSALFGLTGFGTATVYSLRAEWRDYPMPASFRRCDQLMFFTLVPLAVWVVCFFILV